MAVRAEAIYPKAARAVDFSGSGGSRTQAAKRYGQKSQAERSPNAAPAMRGTNPPLLQTTCTAMCAFCGGHGHGPALRALTPGTPDGSRRGGAIDRAAPRCWGSATLANSHFACLFIFGELDFTGAGVGVFRSDFRRAVAADCSNGQGEHGSKNEQRPKLFHGYAFLEIKETHQRCAFPRWRPRWSGASAGLSIAQPLVTDATSETRTTRGWGSELPHPPPVNLTDRCGMPHDTRADMPYSGGA